VNLSSFVYIISHLKTYFGTWLLGLLQDPADPDNVWRS